MVFCFYFFYRPFFILTYQLQKLIKELIIQEIKLQKKIQMSWDQDFNEPIQFVIGDEWKAGNLSYHLNSRPRWEGFINNRIFDIAEEYLCIDDVCVGTYK